MKIEHHISQLLYRYQCVTVPGFGAFLTDTQSAQLHEGTHTFFPPKKVVSLYIRLVKAERKFFKSILVEGKCKIRAISYLR